MKNKINTLWWFLFLFVFLEVIYKAFALHTLFSFNTVYMMPFIFIYAGVFTILTGLFKKEIINKILTYIISLFFIIYFLAQFVYYNFYNSFISLYSIGMGAGQIWAWFDYILKVIFQHILPCLLLISPIIILIVFNKSFTFKQNNKYRYKLTSIILGSGILLSSLSLFINRENIYSNNNLLFNVHYPTGIINRFGLTTAGISDAYRYMSSYKEKYLVNNNSNNETYNKDEYNVLNIDFDKLLREETNDEVKTLHKYFYSKIPTKKNKYTGLFEGKNLIFINAESFDTIAIDKDLTPTLYKLYNESIHFDNYYVPLFPVSTSDGEYMNSTSLLPKEGVWSLYETSKIYMPFSLANSFNKLDYTTYAYHNHTYNFYNRHLAYPKLGFNSYLACGNGLEDLIDCNIWPKSDEELFTSTINSYASKKNNFMAYFMTISGHLSYTQNNDIAKKHWSKVSNLDYSSNYKAFLAQHIDLDNGLNYLLQTLDKKRILDNTVIVIAPDHYPYGFGDEELINLDNNRDGKFGRFNSSLIIWTPNMKETHVDKIVSSLDIIPTLYNLFGIEYDSRLFMGNDAFSNENEGIIILADRSFKTDKVEYDATKNRITFIDKKDMEYLNKMKEEVYSKFTVSSKIIELDYYRKLAGSLE